MGKLHEEAVVKLQNALTKQQDFFVKPDQECQATVKTSYLIAHRVAKWAKPFSDGDFIKECLMDIANNLAPDKKNAFSNISLT